MGWFTLNPANKTNKDWQKLIAHLRKDQFTKTWDGQSLPPEIVLFEKDCPIEAEEIPEFTEWNETEEIRFWGATRVDCGCYGVELRLSSRMNLSIKYSDGYGGPKLYFVPDHMSSGGDRVSLRAPEVERLCQLLTEIKQKMLDAYKNSGVYDNIFKASKQADVAEISSLVETEKWEKGDLYYYKFQYISYPLEIRPKGPELHKRMDRRTYTDIEECIRDARKVKSDYKMGEVGGEMDGPYLMVLESRYKEALGSLYQLYCNGFFPHDYGPKINVIHVDEIPREYLDRRFLWPPKGYWEGFAQYKPSSDKD